MAFVRPCFRFYQPGIEINRMPRETRFSQYNKTKGWMNAKYEDQSCIQTNAFSLDINQQLQSITYNNHQTKHIHN